MGDADVNVKRDNRKAYSYARWSTKEQSEGDSRRRQAEAVQRYVERHGLLLQDQFVDEGKSAYSGSNRKAGSGLARFLQAVEGGAVEPGSWLLVEELDRLSRERPLKAASELEDLVRAGINVVTLNTGMVFAAGDKIDTTAAIQAVVGFGLAHDESVKKGRRVADAWEKNRRDTAAGERKLTSTCPSWLEPTRDKQGKLTGFRLHKERSAKLRGIIERLLAGESKWSIVRELNQAGEPTWKHRVKTTREYRWGRETLRRMLKSRALVGELQPHTRSRDAQGRRVLTPVEAVPNYYPALIDEATWQQLQAVLSRSPLRGRHTHGPLLNVWSGVLRCPKCGNVFTRYRKGRGRAAVLACGRAKDQRCDWRPVEYSDMEEVVLQELPTILAHKPTPDRKLQAAAEAAAADYDDAAERLQEATEQFEKKPSAALADVVRKLEERRDEAKREADEAATAAAQTDRTLTAKRAKELRVALRAKQLEPINAALRQMLEKAEVHPKGDLRLFWRDGTESSWQVGSPF